MTRPSRRKLSFSSLGTPGRTVSQLIALAQHFGLGGIDLRIAAEGGELCPRMTVAAIREVGERLSDAGLDVPSLYCYTRPAWEAGRRLTAYRDELSRLLEIGAALGASYIRSFGLPLDGRDSDAHPDAWVNEIAAAASGALELGPETVGIVLQNHAGTSGARECTAIARIVSSSRFGIAYSPDHVVAHEPESIAAQLSVVAPWTKILYLSDLHRSTDAAGNATYQPCMLGQGVVPLRSVADGLQARGFGGYVSLKWEKLWHPELPEIETALAHFVRLLR